MTRERAEWLIANYIGCVGLLYDHEQPWGLLPGQLDVRGITRDEDFLIRTVWATMSGHTSYFNALEAIARRDENRN